MFFVVQVHQLTMRYKNLKHFYGMFHGLTFGSNR